MKKILLLLLVLCGLSFSQSYLLFEDWEDIGANGWILTGTGIVDYDNKIPVLEGVKNIETDGLCTVKKSFLDSSTVDTWNFFLFRSTDVTTSQYLIIRYFDVSDNLIQRLYLFGDGRLRVYSGIYSDYSTTTLQDNITYYVWTRTKKGTGNNSEFDLYISTTSSKPTTKDIEMTNGAAQKNIFKIAVCSITDGGINYFDYILVDDEEIGSIDFDTKNWLKYSNQSWNPWLPWGPHQ